MATTTYLADIEELRDEIAAAQAELNAIDAAPIPLADAKREIDRYVTALAGRINSSHLIGSAFSPKGLGGADPIRQTIGIIEAGTNGAAFGQLLAWVAPDLLRNALFAAAEQHAQGRSPGLPLDKRPGERERLERRLFELGRQEEALICAAEAENVWLPRRADVDPLVVLMMD